MFWTVVGTVQYSTVEALFVSLVTSAATLERYCNVVGEANTVYNRDLYRCTFPAMITDWRQKWYVGTGANTQLFFPFGFVQVTYMTTWKGYRLELCTALHRKPSQSYGASPAIWDHLLHDTGEHALP